MLPRQYLVLYKKNREEATAKRRRYQQLKDEMRDAKAAANGTAPE
jgi:DnaJ-domain-containing protein 1